MRISDYFVPEHWIADVDREELLPEPVPEWERQPGDDDLPDDGAAPWTWGPEDEARLDRAVAEICRDLGMTTDDDTPF